jgi:hypothetical protein
MAAAQGGFQPQRYGELGLDEAVVLHSSVLLADARRLTSVMAKDGSSIGNGGGPAGPGLLLVCKARLGGRLCEAGGATGLGRERGSSGTARVMPCVFPGATAVYAVPACPPPTSHHHHKQPQQQPQKHRTYYVFDPSAVLPEYLVTFDYDLAPGSPLLTTAGPTVATAGGAGAAACFEVSEHELAAAEKSVGDPAMRGVAAPLLHWLAAAEKQRPEELSLARSWAEEEARWEALVARVESELPEASEASGQLGGDSGVGRRLEEAAGAAPAARLLRRLQGGLLAAAGAAVVRLDVSCCGLGDGDLAPLGALRSLRALVLSFNEITGLKVGMLSISHAVLLWGWSVCCSPAPAAQRVGACPPVTALQQTGRCWDVALPLFPA